MVYKRIEIDLSQPQTDLKVELGNYYKAFLIVKFDTDFDYRINTLTGDKLKASELSGFQGEGVFHTLYVSCAGVAGAKAAVVVYQ